MDLLQLRYFHEVARREHVGRAAAALGVAQPSVSRAVIRLEKELGGPLFDRVGRGLRLNELGRRFDQRVGEGLDHIDGAVTEAHDAVSLELGRVVVAAETLLPVARLAARYRSRHPDARLALKQASGPAMVDLLAAGEVDLCVASQPLEGPDLALTTLDEDDVLLVAPQEHPVAELDEVDGAVLATLGFVVPPAGYWQRTLLDSLAERWHAAPSVVCETTEPGVTLELVRAGLGVTLLPEVARRSTDGSGVVWRRLAAPAARRRLQLVWRQDRYLSRASHAFAALAVEQWPGPPADR